MTVDELLMRLTYRELIEWEAYSALEPFGEERADLRAGIIASTIANVNKVKGKKSFEPKDFMPKFSEETKIVKVPTTVLAAKLESLKHRLTKRNQ